MLGLCISPEAEADLDEIWLHLAKESRSVGTADRFLDRLSSLFSRLARNPYLGRRRDDLRLTYRSIPLGRYVVIYRVAEDRDVSVLRVVHGARDISTLVAE